MSVLDIGKIRKRIQAIRQQKAVTQGQLKSSEEELQKLQADCVEKFDVKSLKQLKESIDADSEAATEIESDIESVVADWERHGT